MANRFNPQTRDASIAARLNPYGLPSRGLMGLWLPEQYDATRKAIPNAVSSIPLLPNILRAQRRLLTNTSFWSGAGTITITDNATAGPEGDTDATTFVATASNWYRGSADSTSLPAGTYTFAVEVASNSGSNESFALSPDNTTTRNVKTATTAWSWQYITFTLAAPRALSQILICSANGSPYTAANLKIRDIILFPGTVTPSGVYGLAGHMYFGQSSIDTKPVAGTGYVDLSTSGAVGLIQFQNTTTFSSGWTACCYGSKVSAGSSYYSFLSKLGSGYNTLSAMFEESGTPKQYFGTSTTKTQNSGLWEANGKGYFLYTARHDGTTNEVWINGARIIQNASAIGTPPSARDYWVGATNTTSLTCKHRIGPMALYNRPLTNAELVQVRSALSARMRRLNVATATERIYAAEGDSITGGFTYSFPQTLGANLSPWSFGANYGVTSSTLANLTSRAATVDAIIQPNRGSTKYILSVLIGANDLAGYSSTANYITDLQTYCLNRKKAGWTVIICTILPIDGGTTHNSRRATVNTDITTNWVSGGYVDAVADFAADAIMGPDNSRSVNPTYWSDTIHPSSTGQARLESIIRTTINAL